MAENKRFKVALSFPGEKREYIKEIAEHLSFALGGREHVFYDNYYEEELARFNLDVYLMNIYKDDSELVAFFLCEEYDKKEWCGLEWRAVRDMVKHKQDDSLMPFRFDNFKIDGALSIDGYIDVKHKTPKEASELIIKRVRKNEKALAVRQNTEYDAAKEKVTVLEKEIAELKAGKHTPEITKHIETLTLEKEALNQQLLQKDEFIAKQQKTREELEVSLAAEKEELKKQALVAVEEKDYNKAEDLLMESAADSMKQTAETFYQIGKVKELKLEYAEALKYYELAAKIPPHNTGYLRKAADLYHTFGMLESSIKCLEQALLADLGQYGHESGAVATDYNDLALNWKGKGNLDLATAYYEKALNMYLNLFGEENQNTAVAYNNIGLAWKEKGDLDKAITYLEKALNINKKLFSEEGRSVAASYNNMGAAWQDKGNPDKAIAYYEKALKIIQKLFGEEYPYVAATYNNIGTALQDKGNTDKAIIYYEKALNIDLKIFGEETPNTAIDYNNIGLAWDEKGDAKKAIEYGQKSYALFSKMFGADNPHTKNAKKNLDDYLSKEK